LKNPGLKCIPASGCEIIEGWDLVESQLLCCTTLLFSWWWNIIRELVMQSPHENQVTGHQTFSVFTLVVTQEWTYESLQKREQQRKEPHTVSSYTVELPLCVAFKQYRKSIVNSGKISEWYLLWGGRPCKFYIIQVTNIQSYYSMRLTSRSRYEH
jgi:hypothetical protein